MDNDDSDTKIPPLTVTTLDKEVSHVGDSFACNKPKLIETYLTRFITFG